ncbi:MAG: hypothetical protein RL199_862 [Pseudomonadota bacterium]|jgi:hypothetical protein
MATPEAGSFPHDELTALLRDPSVAAESIRREMRHAGAEPLPAEALAAVRGALGGEPVVPAFVAALPATLREVLFDDALARKDASLAAALVSSADKSVAKEAKRVLHVLKTRGVSVEAPKPAAPAPTPGAPGVDETPAFMTNVDGWGERILILTRPSRSGIEVAQVVMGDREGVSEARLTTLARKDFRRFVGLLGASRSVLVGEVPRAYARGLVSKGLDLNVQARRATPHGWNDVAFALGQATTPVPSPGRALPLPADQASAAPHAADLLALPEFESWGALGEPWTAELRQVVAERLYDVAWLLHGAGRAEQAGWAIAAAAGLESPRATEEVAFCRALDAKKPPAE